MAAALLTVTPPATPPAAADHQSEGVRPDFSDWHLGDVHAHASGDSALDENKRCDKALKLPWGQRSAEDCATHVMNLMFDRAETNGAEWVIFTEHGAWLGYDRGTYNHGQAVDFHGFLREAANDVSRERGTVAGLIGQEVGSAAPFPCTPARGHFGVYGAGAVVRNSLWDCNEVRYLREMEEVDAWGAINHPFNGSVWNCWYNDDDILGPTNCEAGAVDYAEGLREVIGPMSNDQVTTGLEIVTSNDLPTAQLEDQWDRILQDGYRLGATGGADSHSVEKTLKNIYWGGGEGNHGRLAATARTYAYHDGSIRPSSGFRSDDSAHPIRRALSNGRSIASNGPLYIPQVNGNFPDDGSVFGGDPEFTGNTVRVRVDWPTSGTFLALAEGAYAADPSPEDRLRFAHAPETLEVVVGRVQNPNTCAGAPREPCPSGIVKQTHVVTSTDLANGYATVEVPVDPSWDNIFVRTSGAQTESDGEHTYGFGAYSSPIYLERGEDTSFDGDPSCQVNSLARNDDGSTGAVALPFPINFYGNTYQSLYVNNNGNVTFNQRLGTYTPFQLTASTPPIIAPFFADVDTRGAGSHLVTYGTTTYEGRRAFCVYWDEVGYYSAHTDKLNTFRLYLVDRSDERPGDFDIVFDYRRIAWETGDASGGSGGFGGTSAGAGFSSGTNNPNGFFQIPGSLVNGAFLDGGSHSLTAGSRDSGGQPGVWRFRVRSGLSDGVHSLSGRVVAGSSGGTPVTDALVQVCHQLDGSACTLVRSDHDGNFVASGLPAGSYNLRGFPPVRASHLGTGTATSDPVGPGSSPFVEVVLPGTSAPPDGTILGPSRSGANGIPSLFMGQETTLTTQQCAGAEVSVTVTRGTSTLAGPIAMNEFPPGTYRTTIPAFTSSGSATVVIRAECPDGSVSVTAFTVYIDPSGRVIDQNGQPIENAKVTLVRSDNENGPFEEVPDGSALMSPSNRTNPDATDPEGRFAWDVVAGYYKVRAEKFGCRSADGTADYTETPVLTIPPPALDLELVLDCSLPADGALVVEATVAQVEGGGVPSGDATISATCAGGAVSFSGVPVPVGGEVRLEPVPVGSTCDLTLDGGPADWRLVSPREVSAEIQPHVDTFAQFVGVVGEVQDSFGVSVISADDNPATGSVVLGVSCASGQQREVTLAVDGDGAIVEGLLLGDVCTVSTVDSGGLVVEPASRTVLVQPATVDETWFFASPATGSTFDFTGFGPPVANPPTVNRVRAGATVPIKFGLGGDQGSDVLAPGYPASAASDCTTGAVEGDAEPTTSATGKGLRYDPDADQYVYPWKTPSDWSGTCRQLTVKLTDGSEHTALFRFR